jgi:hypothetical protein
MDWNYPGKTASSVIVDRAGTVWVTSEDRVFFLPRGGRLFQDAGLSAMADMLCLSSATLSCKSWRKSSLMIRHVDKRRLADIKKKHACE